MWVTRTSSDRSFTGSQKGRGNAAFFMVAVAAHCPRTWLARLQVRLFFHRPLRKLALQGAAVHVQGARRRRDIAVIFR